VTRWGGERWVFVAVLSIISLGCVVTIARRLSRIVRDLEAR
jgi:hypothetical protein